MAGLFARQGQMKDAIAAAQSALAIDPANVDAHRVLGSIYASTAEQESSGDAHPAETTAMRPIEHLEKAHRAGGTDRDAGLDPVLARLYMTVGDNKKAADLLTRVTEYEPDDDEAYLLLARRRARSATPTRPLPHSNRLGRESAPAPDAGRPLRGPAALARGRAHL